MCQYEPDEPMDEEEYEYRQREMKENRHLHADNTLYECPDCGVKRLTAYQRAHHYHCDACTHNTETTGGIYGY